MARGSSPHRDSLAAFAIVLFITYTGVIDRWTRRPPQANDPDLVSKVTARLIPPSLEPYSLSKPAEENWGQSEQVQVVQALTRNKTGGFFVETGAYDGEQMSNTLLLERRFGWQGLLIEPSKILFPLLQQKHRRAWILEACCSHTGSPFQAEFLDQAKYGLSAVADGLTSQYLSDLTKRKYQPNKEIIKYSVECFPLYSALLALNQTSVDFFSLDVEGVEMGVLAYLPWHLLDVKIVLVETCMGTLWNPQTDQMRWFMESRGYLAMRLMHDWIFVKRDSEYAGDAEQIVRRVRHQITEKKHQTANTGKLYDPFND